MVYCICVFPFFAAQEAEPDLNAALLENYKVMVGLYARLGVAPGKLNSEVFSPEKLPPGSTHEHAP